MLKHTIARASGHRTLFTGRKLVSPVVQTARNTVYSGLTLFGLALGVYYYSDARAGAHAFIAMPLMHALTDPEASHELAMKAMRTGLTPRDHIADDPSLGFTLWGKQFSNPVGLAAGLDKQAEAVDSLFDLGFAYVEVGTVTPEAQPGNEKPRYFRLPEDEAVINRYGFNSDGHRAVASRLRQRIKQFLLRSAASSEVVLQQLASDVSGTSLVRANALPQSLKPGKVLAINLGKNKNGDEIEDYVKGVRTLGKYADVLVVNVSSPNTPGLRSLQHGESLRNLLKAVMTARDTSVPDTPVCVKIAPDLTQQELQSIAGTIKELKVDGCIISNTTITRPSTLQPIKTITEAGGLSGPPLKPLTMQALKTMHSELGNSCVLIACGGVSSGKDILDYGMAGASFVQGYTGFGYDGPRYARRLKDELLDQLNGRTWSDIIGAQA